jgi:putative addiction module component (TIGR02574 family)
MTTEDITRQILALPMEQRFEIVQAVWHSIDGRDATEEATEAEIVAEALRRDAEMDADPSVKRTYEEVRQAMRRPLE